MRKAFIIILARTLVHVLALVDKLFGFYKINLRLVCTVLYFYTMRLLIDVYILKNKKLFFGDIFGSIGEECEKLSKMYWSPEGDQPGT